VNSPQTAAGWNIQSAWSINASKDVAFAPMHIEGFVDDAVTEALDMAVEQTEARRWVASLARPLSLFDQCRVTIVLSETQGGTSVIDVEVAFEASSARVAVTMGFTTSVIGAPLAWGWRYQSIRSAKARAESIIEALWRALDARTSATAYR
jgi:hypothetical protein